jgi:hypothetical protein
VSWLTLLNARSSPNCFELLYSDRLAALVSFLTPTFAHPQLFVG